MRCSGIPLDACSSPGLCSKSCDLSAALTPCNTWSSGDTDHEGGGCHQSNESTVSNTIVRSWLWSSATGSSPLGYFSVYPMQLIIDHTFCGSRFSTKRLQAIEDVTFLHGIYLYNLNIEHSQEICLYIFEYRAFTWDLPIYI